MEILGFPCNQFLKQESQDSGTIEVCMRERFQVPFKILEKVHVNGPGTHPVFRWLRLHGSANAGPLGWNFCMFLVGSDGKSVRRYGAMRSTSAFGSNTREMAQFPVLFITGLSRLSLRVARNSTQLHQSRH